MPFSHIVGNDHIKSYLTHMVKHNTIANSLLFAGPDGIGKSLFAAAFAKMLLNNHGKIESGSHPDLRILHPEGKSGMHSIDSLRQFRDEVFQSPYEAKRKIFIIHDADRMLPYSANALLKTFEEPPSWAVIILLSGNSDAILPTILSRCRIIRFHTIPEQEIAQWLQAQRQKNAAEAQALAALSRGSIGNACRLTEQNGDPIRGYLLKILSQGCLGSYSKLMEAAAEVSKFLEARRQSVEESIRSSLLKQFPEDLTSVQKQMIEKEVDGMVAMQLASDAQAVLDIILSWFRDMHLMRINGNRAYLLHRDYQDAISDACQKGEFLSLEYVQKAIAQTKLALERSTPVNHCLENLFLQLNFS